MEIKKNNEEIGKFKKTRGKGYSNGKNRNAPRRIFIVLRSYRINILGKEELKAGSGKKRKSKGKGISSPKTL